MSPQTQTESDEWELFMSALDAISQSEFVHGIPGSLRDRLAHLAHPRIYPSGATLFVEGDVHSEFHVVAEGHVRLDMLVPRRGRIPILTAGRGDVLAWSALVGNSIMTSTAVALEPVKTVAFPCDQLKILCDEEHEIGYHVMRQLASALSRRLLATRLQLLDLFSADIPAMDLAPGIGRPGDPEC